MRVRGMADSSGCDPSITLPDSFQQLSRLMQFPEEVAIQLTDVEHRLFSRVSAVDYVRLVSSDLTKHPLTLPTHTASHSAKPPPTVSDLILRFQQVYFIHYSVCLSLTMDVANAPWTTWKDFGPGTDLISLLMLLSLFLLLLLLLLLGQPLSSKQPDAPSFQIGSG